MSEYILERNYDTKNGTFNTVKREEIVRCRDCVFFDDMSFTLKGHMYPNYVCTRRKERDDEVDMTDPDGFCAWGERMDA